MFSCVGKVRVFSFVSSDSRVFSLVGWLSGLVLLGLGNCIWFTDGLGGSGRDLGDFGMIGLFQLIGF